MKHMRKHAAAASLAALALALAGCQIPGTGSTTADTGTGQSATTAAATAQSAETSNEPAAEAGDTVNPPTAEQAIAANANASKVKDDEWSADAAIDVTLSGSSASVADGATGVDVDGSTVKITAAGVYRLKGTLQGQVLVQAPEDALVVLILDGATIDNSAGPAIQVDSADDVAISLSGTNAVSDAPSYDENAEANAAIYAAADLTIGGTGTLKVTGNGKDGITSKDDLYVMSGTLDVTAKDHGLKGKDSLTIADGTVTVKAGGDGLKSDKADDATKGYVNLKGGTVTVEAGQDGIDATTDAILTGGTLNVTSGGGADAGKGTTSGKGIKAGTFLIVDGATVNANSGDDAIHSDGAVRLTSGKLELASGDDGIHANVAAVLDGADVNVSRSYEGLEGGLVTVSAGNVTLNATDDGINGSGATTVEAGVQLAAEKAAAADAGEITEEGPGGPMGGGSEEDTGEQVNLTGGTISVTAGSDSIDSNGSFTVSGGDIRVQGPSSGIEGIIDVNGTVRIDGGTMVAVGSAGQGLSPSTDGAQGWVAASASGTAGSTVGLKSADGTEVVSAQVAGDYSFVFITAPGISNGESYTVTGGSGDVAATAGESAGGGMGGPGGGGAPGGGGPGGGGAGGGAGGWN